MGYDVARFMGEVDEELLCPICSGVLEDPLQAPECEHAFCMGCIQGKLAFSQRWCIHQDGWEEKKILTHLCTCHRMNRQTNAYILTSVLIIRALFLQSGWVGSQRVP